MTDLIVSEQPESEGPATLIDVIESSPRGAKIWATLYTGTELSFLHVQLGDEFQWISCDHAIQVEPTKIARLLFSPTCIGFSIVKEGSIAEHDTE